jgi:hypothetical protein
MTRTVIPSEAPVPNSASDEGSDLLSSGEVQIPRRCAGASRVGMTG